jgi:hypothetical protein
MKFTSSREAGRPPEAWASAAAPLALRDRYLASCLKNFAYNPVARFYLVDRLRRRCGQGVDLREQAFEATRRDPHQQSPLAVRNILPAVTAVWGSDDCSSRTTVDNVVAAPETETTGNDIEALGFASMSMPMNAVPGRDNTLEDADGAVGFKCCRMGTAGRRRALSQEEDGSVKGHPYALLLSVP